MKTRKVVFLSLFVGMLGVSASSTAGYFDDVWETYYNTVYGVKIDFQGRRLDDHEDDGRSKPWSQKLGHTIKEHVDKDSFYLAKRCQDFRRRGQHTKYASTYDDIRVAAKYVKIAMNYDRQQFDSDLRKTQENKIFIQRVGMNKNDGYAVNCDAFDKSKLIDWPQFGLQLYFGKGDYFGTSSSVVRKRKSQPGGWFIVTSYPKPN